uniref:Sugar phosphate transporter domain-containing protein n=1 Tax=Dunaliella tertiolecta TaxID=3047 RepID=A0A7S3QQI0_DUNTE|mmetsp:Transcript_26974/g.72893  ORF Transcript_26974/g.72893 Transcript_26974/m.72893 type:complete len:349 (+) Transcript_26974:184-1230(+)|eukprot:CAMPEP_0202354048 /NCGR_PEP_ID=MMETSP1126-20121109/9541_1 /ASSEMBLY_ACC=CAM_ASM_000457 /TAXON_ID=3047 /ORGANISM="Dunaliella tertiolecta, Strain CCMP1320" /LENGTH=348 /DNA_ID=CAMNT_0048946471 /DNA_START=165 /DNA_END=1211 /DNA_ORIENTATION=+
MRTAARVPQHPLDVEKGGSKAEQQARSPLAEACGVSTVLLSGLCYAASSGCLTLLNKHALDGFGFRAPNALLCFQCVLTVILVKACEMMGLIKQLQPVKWDLVLVWLPVNLLFVGMIGSSFYALQNVGVGMVTVWKNLSNVVTAIGDIVIYKKSYNWPVWATLIIMLVSAMVGASTDVRFTWSGYGWQMANCLFTSTYALYLRSVMDKVAEHTTNKQRMDEFSMVFYNNLLSIPCIMFLMYIFGEYNAVASPTNQAALHNPLFQLVAGLSGIIGFAISFSSLWFLSQTTATIYSLVGALNKIPVAIFGLVIFREPTNPKNLASIILGLLAGVMFVRAKQQPQRATAMK